MLNTATRKHAKSPTLCSFAYEFSNLVQLRLLGEVPPIALACFILTGVPKKTLYEGPTLLLLTLLLLGIFQPLFFFDLLLLNKQ